MTPLKALCPDRRAAGSVPRRAWICLVLLLHAAPLLAQKNTVQRPRYGGTLVVAGTVDLRGMNSLVANEAFTSEFLEHVLFMPLVRFTPSLQLEPWLASSWTMTGDTGVVFKLRKDVFWHDGVKTSAYDVAYTFQAAKDPEMAFPNGDYFENWDRAQVIDSFTVRFHFKPHPDPMMGLPFTPIMPKHLLDTIPAARMRQAAFNRAPVGNGPFRFVAYHANSDWTFEANPRFPRQLGGRPYVDRLVWRVIPDNSAQVAALLTGDVHIITAPGARNLKGLDERPELRAIAKPSRKYLMIDWNGKRTPFGDPRVRRALTLALDRQRMIDLLRGGFAQIATGPISPFHWAYDASAKPLPYDPAAARTLLAQAGLRDRDNDGTLEDANGKPLAFELLITANNQFNKDVGEMIRGDLEKVGAKVTVRPVDGATLIGSVSSPQRTFDAALMAWESDFHISLRDNFHSDALGGPYQSASYSNPVFDRLLDRAAATTNRAEARPLWARVQQILRQDEPWTFLWYNPDLIAANERVRGADMDIRGIFVNAQKWWLADARGTRVAQ